MGKSQGDVANNSAANTFHDPFRLRLAPPGAFANLYEQLSRLHGGDDHLRSLMSEFEQAFGSYVRTKQAHELKACITSAFVYAEGLAGKTSGENGTLGDLCDGIKCWPHATIRKSLKTLYGFRNDYPGLGHGGDPKGKLRDLEPRDAIVICLLLLSYSGYLSNEVKIEDTLAL